MYFSVGKKEVCKFLVLPRYLLIAHRPCSPFPATGSPLPRYLLPAHFLFNLFKFFSIYRSVGRSDSCILFAY